jgi:hypothetical protein
MAEFNKHGLSRYIESATRLEVRRRCGFGCVICGVAFYDYEHFDPDFKDAKEHRPESITLLCMQCNQKRRRGTLSVESVRYANTNPKCLEQGFSSETFDFGQGQPIEVVVAGLTFTNCPTLIAIDDLPLLSIKPPEGPSRPYKLSGFFADSAGEITLKIDDNVWSVGADNWDIECVGPRVIIRRGPGDIVLTLLQEPPRRLIVERLNMEARGVRFRGREDLFETSFNGINWNSFQGGNMSNCTVGMMFSNKPRPAR